MSQQIHYIHKETPLLKTLISMCYRGVVITNPLQKNSIKDSITNDQLTYLTKISTYMLASYDESGKKSYTNKISGRLLIKFGDAHTYKMSFKALEIVRYFNEGAYQYYIDNFYGGNLPSKSNAQERCKKMAVAHLMCEGAGITELYGEEIKKMSSMSSCFISKMELGNSEHFSKNLYTTSLKPSKTLGLIKLDGKYFLTYAEKDTLKVNYSIELKALSGIEQTVLNEKISGMIFFCKNPGILSRTLLEWESAIRKKLERNNPREDITKFFDKVIFVPYTLEGVEILKIYKEGISALNNIGRNYSAPTSDAVCYFLDSDVKKLQATKMGLSVSENDKVIVFAPEMYCSAIETYLDNIYLQKIQNTTTKIQTVGISNEKLKEYSKGVSDV